MKTDTPRTDEAKFWHYEYRKIKNLMEQQLAAVTEQRDRLAEALNRIANNNVQDLPETDYAYELGRMEGIAKIALQSLTTNDERTCADS